MESGDDGLESEANVRPRPRLTGAGQPRGCPAARWTAIDRGLSRDPLAQARLNRSAKGAGTGHSPRYPKSGTTQSDRLLVEHRMGNGCCGDNGCPAPKCIALIVLSPQPLEGLAGASTAAPSF